MYLRRQLKKDSEWKDKQKCHFCNAMTQSIHIFTMASNIVLNTKTLHCIPIEISKYTMITSSRYACKNICVRQSPCHNVVTDHHFNCDKNLIKLIEWRFYLVILLFRPQSNTFSIHHTRVSPVDISDLNFKSIYSVHANQFTFLFGNQFKWWNAALPTIYTVFLAIYINADNEKKKRLGVYEGWWIKIMAKRTPYFEEKEKKIFVFCFFEKNVFFPKFAREMNKQSQSVGQTEWSSCFFSLSSFVKQKNTNFRHKVVSFVVVDR